MEEKEDHQMKRSLIFIALIAGFIVVWATDIRLYEIDNMGTSTYRDIRGLSIWFFNGPLLDITNKDLSPAAYKVIVSVLINVRKLLLVLIIAAMLIMILKAVKRRIRRSYVVEGSDPE